MKLCPLCDREYYDETLNYCLEDGATLTSESPTAVLRVNAGPVDTAARIKPGEQTAENPSSRPISPATNNMKFWLVPALLVAVAAGAGYLAYVYFFSTSANKPIESVAVLPFVNKSGNPDSEYLSDGLAESLVYRLSQVPDLKVSPPSSVVRFKGQDVDPVRAGIELGVSAVVVGKIVEREGNLTVSAELIDVRQNKLLWGEQYDRKIADLLATQREIAREIVSGLRLKVSSDERGLTKHYTENNEAYQLYLRARYHWNKRTFEGNNKTIEYLNQVIEKDPNFALAYSALSDAYSVPNNAMSPTEAMPKAKAAATRALELDDSLAEAHTSLARVLAAWEWDWKGAEREYKRATDLNPRYALAHQWFGLYLATIGQTDASLAERKEALDLEPLSPIVNFEYGQSFFWMRNYPSAIEQFQKSLELDPNLPAVYVYLGASYDLTGRYDAAIDAYQRIPAKSGNEWGLAMGGLARVYATTNRKEEARKIIAELENRRKSEYVPAPGIALAYDALGEKDQVFKWLEKAEEDRAFQLQWLKVDPRWDDLRHDPRFIEIIRRMGLP